MKKKILLLGIMVLSVFSLNAQNLPFTESFEYGLNKWNASSSGTVEATATQSIVGSKSLHIIGVAGNSVQRTFASSQPVNEIMYYLRVTSGEGGTTYFSQGTASANAVFYSMVTGGNFVVTGASGAYAVCSVANNKWIKVEVKNINYTSFTYDIWINDTLRRKDMDFRGNVPGVNSISIGNSGTSHEAWWDAIYVGIVDYNKPQYTGNDICKNDTANVVFAQPVCVDSSEFNVSGTNFSFGPINADSTVNYKHPYIQSAIVPNVGIVAAWSGNMFDITATKDLSIYGFDINTNETPGTSNMKIYYRKGTYVGHNTSNVGWLLHDSVSFNKNPSAGLCWVELSKNLTIPKGETYGLYLCYESGVDYAAGNGSNQTVTNNHMTLNLGVGGAYFNVTNSPRVWSGRIYYEVAEEQIDSKQITTTFANNNSHHGNMVDVYAKNDIIIDSLNVNIVANGWVKVYYRNRTCVGNNTSNVGWAMLDSVQVISAGTGNPTKVVLNNRLLIPADSLYGVYICSESNMNYTDIIAGTNDVYIDSNMVLTGLYGGTNTFSVTSSRVWNGTMYYTVRNNAVAKVGVQTSTFSGNVRGYCFVAPKDFMIKGLMIPNDVAGDQCIEILRFNESLPPQYSNTTNNFTSLGYWKGMSQGGVIPCDIYVNKGDYIGVYGKGGTITSYCSDSTMDILGATAYIHRSGMQFNLLNEQMHDVWIEMGTTESKGRVNLYVEDVSKHGGQNSLLLDVHTPVVNLGTDTIICANTSIGLDAGAFSVYNWSTGSSTQTVTIDSTGTGIGSANVWVVVQDQYGCKATDTVIITFEICIGIDENEGKPVLSLYPNPTNGNFSIDLGTEYDEIFVTLIDIYGKILSKKTFNHSQLLNLSIEEPAGIYFLKVEINNKSTVIRLLKE